MTEAHMSDQQEAGGGCLCGEVRYRVNGHQLRGTICHCEICRKWSGGAFLPWTLFDQSQFEWTKGTPGVIQATPAVIRSFCSRCGSPLTFEFTDSSEIIGVTTGTLDKPHDFPPTRHNWTSREVSWLRTLGDLPRNTGDAGDEKTSS